MRSFTTDRFRYIDFREMDEDLSRTVWECRNLPEIRKYMVNKDSIPYDKHLRFIQGLHDNNDARYYSVLIEDVFVGSVNLHLVNPTTAERGIYIHPDYQGRGLAKSICRDFYNHIRDRYGITTILTKVLKDNISSNRLENVLGAVRQSEDDEFYHYSLGLCNL